MSSRRLRSGLAVPLPPSLRRVGLALVVSAAGVLSWPWLAEWQRERFAEEMAERAAQSTALSVASVRDMWQLGLSATRPLVELAAAQRPELAAAAQEAISDQLAAWEVEFANGRDRAAFAKRLEVLISSLRASAGRFDWAGQLWAKKLARDIARHSGRLEGEAAWAVLTACEQVLSTPELARPRTPAVVYEEAANAKPRAVEVDAPPPVEAKPLPVAKPQARAVADAPPAPPAELAVIMPSTESPRAIGVDPDNPLRPADESPLAEATLTITAAANRAAAPIVAPIDVPSPLEMRHERRRLRELSDRQLMILTETAPKFDAAAARHVLRTRGYSDELLEVTRQLRTLPATQRRQALERAASLPAADARRLLRWFVADEDAEVRLHALTLLATTGDPQLSEIARRRAVEDADPRVAELATELLEAR